MKNADQIKEVVKQKYSLIARQKKNIMQLHVAGQPLSATTIFTTLWPMITKRSRGIFLMLTLG